jgi:peptidoglycan/LPS O-acetylase OafA/YrhL
LDPPPAPPPISRTNIENIQRHLDYIDGLRALLALYVVQRHVEVGLWGVTEKGTRETFTFLSLFRSAHFAVDIFIVISGFCLALPAVRHGFTLRGGAATFYKRRALRILPPYYAALGLSMLAMAIVGRADEFTGARAPTIWHHLLLVHDVLSPLAINSALWSIAVEVHIYILFPVLVWSFRRWGAARTFAWGTAVSLGLWALAVRTRHTTASPHYLVLFMFGMLVAAPPASTSWDAARRKVPWTPLALALIFVGLLMRRRGIDILPIDLIVGLGGAFLLVGGAGPGPLSRILSLKPLAFAGRFSYSLYLIHPPVLDLLTRVTRPLHLADVWGVRRLPVMFAFVLASTLVAYVFYLLVERPAVRMAQLSPAK